MRVGLVNLAEAIYKQGLKMIAGGADPMSISRGIHKGCEAVTESIKKMSSPVNEKEKKEIAQVATIAGNNDPSIGAVLADAFIKVGKNGVTPNLTRCCINPVSV